MQACLSQIAYCAHVFVHTHMHARDPARCLSSNGWTMHQEAARKAKEEEERKKKPEAKVEAAAAAYKVGLAPPVCLSREVSKRIVCADQINDALSLPPLPPSPLNHFSSLSSPPALPGELI